LEGPLTQEKRGLAKDEFARYGRGIEEHLGVTSCTISNHMIIVEADHQIPVTGPISESVGAWVERLMFTLLEQIRRRRVSSVPEKSMVTGYLLDQFVRAHRHVVPDLPHVNGTRGIRDEREEEPMVSCFVCLFVCLLFSPSLTNISDSVLGVGSTVRALSGRKRLGPVLCECDELGRR